MGEAEQFITRVNDLYRFEAIQGHLGWDQETIMPAKGAQARGETLAWLAGQRHSRLIDDDTHGNFLLIFKYKCHLIN